MQNQQNSIIAVVKDNSFSLVHFYISNVNLFKIKNEIPKKILKYFEIETFSRRINNEHRLVYQINEQKITVLVLTAFGHYK